jgi:hypothetical protein
MTKQISVIRGRVEVRNGKVYGGGLFQSLGRKINDASAFSEHAIKSGTNTFMKAHEGQLLKKATENAKHEIKKRGGLAINSGAKMDTTLAPIPAIDGGAILLNKLAMTPKFLTKKQNRNNIKLVI